MNLEASNEMIDRIGAIDYDIYLMIHLQKEYSKQWKLMQKINWRMRNLKEERNFIREMLEAEMLGFIEITQALECLGLAK